MPLALEGVLNLSYLGQSRVKHLAVTSVPCAATRLSIPSLLFTRRRGDLFNVTTQGKGTPKIYLQVLRWGLSLKTGHIVCIATHDQMWSHLSLIHSYMGFGLSCPVV